MRMIVNPTSVTDVIIQIIYQFSENGKPSARGMIAL